MKRIVFLIISVCIIVYSCTEDDFLDRFPQEQITEFTYFNTANDLKLFVNQFYASLPVEFSVNDANSDNQVPTSKNSFLGGTYTVPAQGGGWSSSDWSGIRSCNFFLQRYGKANTADTLIYSAEVRFFRALFYWQKVVRFGDVPIVTTDLTDESPELFSERKPRKEVMDFVLTDLNYAISNLPGSVESGRVGKYAALALKSRICLWEGTFRKYHGTGDETVFLQESASASKMLIDSDKFALYSTGKPNEDYRDLFIQDDLSNNPEVILSKTYINGILSTSYSRTTGANSGWSKDFIDSYLCDDGLPISLSTRYQGDESASLEVTNRDPRYAQTVATPGFVLSFLADGTQQILDQPNIGTSLTSTGYQIIKGRSSDPTYWNAGLDDLDRFIFRYAEVLLNYAEAKAELGELNQEILDVTINKLRQRVAMPDMNLENLVQDPDTKFPEISTVLQEIRRERRIELAGDGFRFRDLLRWKAGELIENHFTMLGMKIVPDYRDSFTPSQIANVNINDENYIQVYPTLERVWDDKMYFYPLPIDQLTLNPAYNQNPGWSN